MDVLDLCTFFFSTRVCLGLGFPLLANHFALIWEEHGVFRFPTRWRCARVVVLLPTGTKEQQGNFYYLLHTVQLGEVGADSRSGKKNEGTAPTAIDRWRVTQKPKRMLLFSYFGT